MLTTLSLFIMHSLKLMTTSTLPLDVWMYTEVLQVVNLDDILSAVAGHSNNNGHILEGCSQPHV